MVNGFSLERLEATRLYQGIRERMNRKLVNFLKSTALVQGERFRVAEVACGSGYSAHLLAAGQQVSLSVAADINLEDYRQAQIENYQATFVIMDLFRPALQKGSFDLVWNSSSVEELDQPQAAIEKMAWLVKPSGNVFVGVPYRFGIAGLLLLIPNAKLRQWLGCVYDHESLRSLLESAGLKVESEFTYLGWTFLGMLASKRG